MKTAFTTFIVSFLILGAVHSNERPNIILMMADDLGWGDPSYNDGWIDTPTLDSMAASGLRFDRFYSASAVCSPTRGSCLTGRHPLRLGISNANIGRLEADETPLSEVLDGVGYATGHFGKWHLGTLTTLRSDSNRGAPGNTEDYSPPWQHSFDASFATEAKVPTFHPMRVTVNGAPEPVDFADQNFYGTYYWTPPADPALWATASEGVPVAVDDNLSGDDSRVVMDRVIPFVQDAVASDTPFFTVVWFHTPHKPLPDPDGIDGVDSDEAYVDAIVGMDAQIARLRAELDTLGVTDNTMFWFCSDNGPEDGVGSAGPFRARKRSLHEGGVRVPGFLVWPDKIPTPQVTDFPSVTSDYYPTILDYLCIDVPGQKPIDGISLRGVIEGTATVREQPIGFNYLSGRSWVNQQYKLISKDNGANFELYDLLADSAEVNNIAAANPDIVASMMEEFDAWELAVANDTEYVPPVGAPSVVLSNVADPPAGVLLVAIEFSETVTGLTTDDFSITNGSPTMLAGSGSSYTLTITPQADGLVAISLPAGSVLDVDLNPNLASDTLSLSFGIPASAILIDFGRTDNQTLTNNFNNVHGEGIVLATPEVELVDSNGADTGITLSADFSSGGSWAGAQADYAGPYPALVADQPVSAVQDSMFIREPANTTITLSGLDGAAVYEILIYGARSNNGGPNAEWTVTDNNGDTLQVLDVFDNSTGVAAFSGLVPDENNEIAILYTTTADGTRPRGALNFMQLSLLSTASFEITGIEYDQTAGAPVNTITWSSSPDVNYGVDYSTDLKTWSEVDDGIESEGDSTSYSHELLPLYSELVGVPRLYYRVRIPVTN